MTRQVLGIDVGGSSIKAGLVDVDAGRLSRRPDIGADTAALDAGGADAGDRGARRRARRRERQRRHRLPERHQAGHGAHRGQHRSRAGSAPTARRSPRAPSAGRRCCSNDADAAGIAEMRWGAGRGCNGRGHHGDPRHRHRHARCSATAGCFPNTELGHLELRGMDAEKWASAQVRTVRRAWTFPRGARASTSICERLHAAVLAGPVHPRRRRQRALRGVRTAAALARAAARRRISPARPAWSAPRWRRPSRR